MKRRIGKLVSATFVSMAIISSAACGSGAPTVRATPPRIAPSTDQTPTSASTESPSPMPAITPVEDWTYLAALAPVQSDTEGWPPGINPADVNGAACLHALTIWRNPGFKATLHYNLSRSYGRFRASVGLRDDSSPDAQCLFEIYGDDRLLDSHEVGFGELADFDVSVAGVLRLQLAVTTTGPNTPGYAVWCDPQLKR